jgi:hypothetical protein
MHVRRESADVEGDEKKLASLVALAGTVGAGTISLLSATDSSGSPPTDFFGVLLQSGPFAIILVLILTDKLAPTGERNRLRQEVADYKSEIQKLNDKLLQVLPPLTELLPTMRALSDRHEHDMETQQLPPPPQQRRGNQ